MTNSAKLAGNARYLNQVRVRWIAGLAVLAGGIVCMQTVFREPADAADKANATTGTAGDAVIPATIERLKLTSKQHAQAQEVVEKYGAKMESVWKQYHEKYREMVQLEVNLLAAIEDHLTDAQRTQIRDQRRKMAHSDKAAAEGTKSASDPATARPGEAADEEIAAAGVSLTSEQEAAADRAHHRYVGRLRTLNRDMQTLHTRLVALEADKLVELEKLLTKEQLAQLRDARENGTDSPRLGAAEKTSAKTE
jgi:hypothetical protein